MKPKLGMQFKYPELLWALLLLLIPVFIHLFQLRRFKKTPFTNVKSLQKVVAKSQKSKTLKKWLLLATRMLLFTALILSFAQPFIANSSALKEKETVIYLDNSFSMQLGKNEGSLLSAATQDLLKSIPTDQTFSIFTNDEEFKNVQVDEIRNDLLSLNYTSKQLNLDEVTLKAKSFFSQKNNLEHHLILISDFQESIVSSVHDSLTQIEKYVVKMAPEGIENISIDSVYISKETIENIEVTALLSSNSIIESTPISLFNDDKLIAKTSVKFIEQKGLIQFTLPSEETVKGRLEIVDNGLSFDNRFYFSINKKNRPKVLCIGDENVDFLSKIFVDDEFEFNLTNTKDLNYQLIESQNLIILNELVNLPSTLIKSLASFSEEGGSLLLIPSLESELTSYNSLMKEIGAGTLHPLNKIELNISSISFSHQLYEHVFDQKVNNFQYPKVNAYYKPKTPLQSILSYQNNEPFLFGNDNTYVFSSPISSSNSNFKQSPLIVPTIYQMGVRSLKPANLYYKMEDVPEVDIDLSLNEDQILKVTNGSYEFIPRQQSFANKVRLFFESSPSSDGNYQITFDEDISSIISFNHSRKESKLYYSDLNTITAKNRQTSVSSLFEDLQNDNSITALWKWFVILAILFILAEILIIKILK